MSAKKSLPSHDHDAVHKPSKEFSAKARIPSMAAYKKRYKESIEKPAVFWAREAKELVCKADRLAFPIKDGIPVMLEEDARKLDPLEEVAS